MEERQDAHVDFLTKMIDALSLSTKKLEELKIDSNEVLAELKKNIVLPKKDDQWEIIIRPRIRRIEMLTVKTKMSHVLSVLKQGVANLENWLDELGKEIKLGEEQKNEKKD
ncbi:MAG: hypothetical protein CO001_01935 [Candidatus Portnoybacteria bacterium CG_4_8_14_3_um_filter_40_10]|uniref:Uncharacterized protein n=4 Tax=Candidatus Portnoyibacteriota TaxID=1817913 RepID=A0A2M7IIH1_9BACT|nr:MAG: hypothetical protein COV84_03490 [Candidatus Portnoybacteria bacterium CG11_big_fil_rev_8_21_14_0_20_40_15]PIS31957.1 MAG: hypothetical protein COT41_00195 [Candidatus Portnoybacteria bacterium CG08_land_8_20_14_0_20_40_83]PIW76327.1 MAG: hypothetical protein CO001_01935 [Candidatus Portnoybacteria bacterium CG_4_8_14_3_um_filter_40_10]PIY74749.1 MAG: hypothetical protein COY85_02375 [Candidatus Portnoybacteria bacterium CG_4_10_14_0_8_um_filter_40_50]PJA64308.1 MAG: hypothetical protei